MFSSIFRKDHLPTGLLLGMLVPLVTFGLLWLLFIGLDAVSGVLERGLSANFRVRTLGLVSIGTNALMLNQFYKSKATNSMRGLVIATSIFIGIWCYFFAAFLINR